MFEFFGQTETALGPCLPENWAKTHGGDWKRGEGKRRTKRRRRFLLCSQTKRLLPSGDTMEKINMRKNSEKIDKKLWKNQKKLEKSRKN